MRRRKTAIFFLVLGICLSALALALNVGWILLSLREVAILVLGIVFFAVIITGLILNTVFLVREIRRNEQHDAFLNSVTHELKTPIAAIKLYLETLKTRDVTPEKRAEFYDVMISDADRLLNTVENVLAAGKLKEKTAAREHTRLDLVDVINKAVEAVRTRYDLAPELIRFPGSAERFEVLGDADELETVFVNLLDNAVKYSGGEPRISIRAKKAAMNSRVAVLVRDQGIGLQLADLRRIFKRFYRASDPAARDVRGTGLGLYIVRSIVERHGGRVTAESKGAGRGTTFLVQLPLAE
ncbi:MAG TPA: HAMP domain-containing sensor histidine kinase [Pyrinomonadaceae bacterium]|nr:HAMP domain-containing sensor histidine kinase [Pyrinomonadaceae bacterium]HMP66978.1 HAMP domain-containing sensor histidine kinase [Pyrinomonadaceae bacterium]